MNFQYGPYALSSYTIVGDKIMKSWRVEELLIDSAFKSNKETFELFTVIANCMGTGFPMGYFLLEDVTWNVLISTEESLTLVSNNLKIQFPRLNPSFFFTDKESSQIKAIGNVVNINASLFMAYETVLKHEIEGAAEGEKAAINDTQDSKLNYFIDSHYFQSTVSCDKKPDQLLQMGQK